MVLLAWIGVAALFIVHELVMLRAARALGVPATRGYGIVRGLRGPRGMLACAIGFAAMYLAVTVLAFVYIHEHGIATGKVTQVVRVVEPGSPATGKLAPEDRIVAIDGVAISDGIAAAINARAGAPVRVTFERDGAADDVTIQPTSIDGRWRLGITLWADRERRSDVVAALSLAWRYPIAADRALWTRLSRDAPTDPGGPVRIVEEYPTHEPLASVELHTLVEVSSWALALVLLLDVIRVALCLRRPQRA